MHRCLVPGYHTQTLLLANRTHSGARHLRATSGLEPCTTDQIAVITHTERRRSSVRSSDITPGNSHLNAARSALVKSGRANPVPGTYATDASHRVQFSWNLQFNDCECT